ncbi:hypothetical protein [Streptomyces sp. NPDC053048]|uniref:hypothetical protein n=1 Tax=Streptomyces sp. NPDC053048 TaxID=3365694 RepID=UPI0037D425D3
MGFWGYLLVGRGGDRALAECPVLASDRGCPGPDRTVRTVRTFAGGWRLWTHPGPPEPAGVDALVRALADETGAPALAAYVMESDCAVIGGTHRPGDDADDAGWSACLGRTPLARYMADTELGLDELFPTPEAAAAHCAAWAAAAGHAADADELAGVLAADPEPLVENLFHELLARLGMVETVEQPADR